jgi:hypothetical protein
MAPEGQPAPPTAWISYLAAADATAQAITDNGGRVLMPTTAVRTFGRTAVASVVCSELRSSP